MGADATPDKQGPEGLRSKEGEAPSKRRCSADFQRAAGAISRCGEQLEAARASGSSEPFGEGEPSTGTDSAPGPMTMLGHQLQGAATLLRDHLGHS